MTYFVKNYEIRLGDFEENKEQICSECLSPLGNLVVDQIYNEIAVQVKIPIQMDFYDSLIMLKKPLTFCV